MLTSLGVALTVLVVGALGWYVWTLTWGWLTGLDEFRVYPGRLALAPVNWLDTESLIGDIRRTDDSGLLRGNCSYFTPKLAERVAKAYTKSPWVERVTLVQRKFPNRLEIGLVVREPFAVVRWQAGEAIIDRQGVVLSPLIYRVPSGGLKQPDILLSGSPKIAARSGAVWRSKDVTAAMDMLHYAMKKPELARLNIRSVEVRRERGMFKRERLCLVLNTELGPEIRWGLPPGDPKVGITEAETEVKVGALQTWLRHPGELSTYEYIDIRNGGESSGRKKAI